MASLRRLDGSMEPHRRPAGHRILLPAEIELCNAVGITEEEYFYFVDLTQSYNGERAKEYELVPDIRNNPTTIAIISLVIGLASSAAGYLLAPKPRSPQQQKGPPSLRTADITGTDRFAPQVGFDSVQELATLGQIIPLIFTRKGIRVNSQLVWSQMLSKGTGHQLNAVFIFGSGPIDERPDFQGYAVGDLTLKNYTNAKLALYFKKDGSRILNNQSDKYAEGTLQSVSDDPFTVYWQGNYQPYFSGTRTPSTQTQFGVYAPMPNGTRYKPNYELIMVPNDTDTVLKNDLRKKKEKVYNTNFPRLAGVVSYDGNTLTYRLDGAKIENVTGDSYEPWGIEDVRAAVDGGRTEADNNIQIGEQYLAGNALVVCTSTGSTKPWSPDLWKTSTFNVIERGQIDVTGGENISSADPPYTKTTLQRVAIATVSNSRACDATEIGIKSTVWRQITGFTNVNSYPGDSTVEEYQEKNGSITLGSLQKYVKRLSFFSLLVRKLGTTDNFQDISGGQPFCIRGNAPQEQYNYIRITHPQFSQYEFKLRPMAGNYVRKFWLNRNVWLLRPGTLQSFTARNFNVEFAGEQLLLTRNEMSNPEWILGKPSGSGNDSYVKADNLNSDNAISDLPVYDAENSSHFSGPEHEIAYVNEIVKQAFIPKYDKLAIAGIQLNSSKEWASFSQLSAYFKKGIEIKRLFNGRTEATNLLPEIAYTLLTDPVVGAGNLISTSQVDAERMTVAAKFCNANGFTWDGVVSDRQNLREWIHEQAGYCLLDFTILGGKFSLYPSVPFSANSQIDQYQRPDIKALFTDGNIRNLQVSFLSPEERQLFQAVCLWRSDTPNGFPETRTVKVRFKDSAGGSTKDPEEVFDMSGFATTQEHPIKFAKYALQTRKEVDHGVRFETTPQAAMSLIPGEYFRLVSEVTHTSRFKNGSIDDNGVVTGLDLEDSFYDIYYWHPGTVGVQRDRLTISNNKTNQTSLYGTVFSVVASSTQDRVYKVESLNYGEDGLVEIAGSYVPLDSSGRLKVLDWSDAQFEIESY